MSDIIKFVPKEWNRRADQYIRLMNKIQSSIEPGTAREVLIHTAVCWLSEMLFETPRDQREQLVGQIIDNFTVVLEALLKAETDREGGQP